MAQDPIDMAADLLCSDIPDLSSPILEAVADGGEGFNEACNRLSVRVAERFIDGSLGFGDADCVMNWVWQRMTERLGTAESLTAGQELGEPAFSIFSAFDEGEYHHRGDDPEINPALKYTIPAINSALAKLNAVELHETETTDG